MLKKLFYKFEFADIHKEKDRLQRAGDFCLAPLRYVWGYRLVTVESASSGGWNKFTKQKITANKIKRFAAAIFAILLLPMTGFLTLAGSVALYCSSSHKDLYEQYKGKYRVLGD